MHESPWDVYQLGVPVSRSYEYRGSKDRHVEWWKGKVNIEEAKSGENGRLISKDILKPRRPNSINSCRHYRKADSLTTLCFDISFAQALMRWGRRLPLKYLWPINMVEDNNFLKSWRCSWKPQSFNWGVLSLTPYYCAMELCNNLD